MNNTMQYKNYVGSIEFSEDDMTFFGKVLGLKSLISYEGDTAKELYTNFSNAIDNYLETCEKNNIEIEKPFKGSFNIRISPELHKRIAIISLHNKISINQYINEALEQNIRQKTGWQS